MLRSSDIKAAATSARKESKCHLWIRRSFDIVSFLIAVAFAVICVVVAIAQSGNVAVGIPYTAVKGSLSAAGCHCRFGEPFSHKFVTFDNDKAEADCRIDMPTKALGRPKGHLYANLSEIPCIDSEYDFWYKMTTNTTLPAIGVKTID